MLLTSDRSAPALRVFVLAVLAALVLTGLPLQSAQAATTYYVATNGSDSNPGTQAAPFRSVGRGISALRAGDTLQIRGGTYTENINTTVAAGSAGAPIRITRYPGEQPVLRGLLWLRRPQFLTVEGLHVTWNTSNGSNQHMVKITDGRSWTLRGNRFYGARSYAGLLVASSTSGEPSNWRVTGNCIHDTVPSNNTNQDHLIYVNAAGSNDGVIEGNLLFNATNGEAVKVGGPDSSSPGTSNVLIRYNTMHNTSQNLLFAWRSGDNQAYRNILGHAVNLQVRGYQLTASGNVVRENAVHSGARWIVNDSGHEQVVDGGNLMDVDSRFDRTDSCTGFNPQNGAVQGYGHLASPSGGGQPPVEDPTEPPVADPTEPPVEDPTEPPVEDPTEPPVEDPTEPPVEDPTEPVSPIEAAIEISRATWADGSAETALLARVDKTDVPSADDPLPEGIGGPVLLAGRWSLPAAVGAELERVLPQGSTVHLVGGGGEWDRRVTADLRALGFEVRHLKGNGWFPGGKGHRG